MAYPASLLITRAFYLSGITARQLETVSGQQMADGLFLLNELLDFKAFDTRFIPYYTYSVLNLVQGQEEYFVPNLFEVETFTFNIGPVRFPTSSSSRVDFFGRGRVDNIESLPFEWRFEREKGGGRIRLYFLPAQNYVSHIMGKYGLTDVTVNTDLSAVYDGAYIAYLRYALAQYICQEYDVNFAPDKAAMLQTMEKKLSWVSPPDLTLNKMSFINRGISMNWAQANIGKGYTRG